MAVSTVYACLTKLAGAVLQLPVHQFRIDPKGERERVRNTPLHWMLNEQPHAMWTSASWKEWIVRCVALRGDQHTEILRNSNSAGGQIIGLEPHHPDCVVARQVNKRLVYDVMDRDTGKVRTVDQDDMLHFAGFGFNGLHSLSAIQHAAKQSIGNSLAAADYSGRAVGSGEMPQITIQSDKVLSPKQTQELRENFVAIYTGKGASKLPLVLTEGVKANVLGISPVDMQLIESRKYEKEDICQALGVPPIIIGDSDKASSWGTGIEQITLGFVRFTIKPMLCRWEEEINRKFFRNAGNFVEFELDGLLRGDSKAQSEVFKAALGGPGAGDAYMTVNEVRKLKNLPPIAGGNELFKAQRSTDAATNSNTTGATA
jgi:HK97 family phage portal protein